ncbi:MAG TPA: XRE family transcriptional regulator [Actinophytocola sp.]|nr:XRE family transcriptional regulator [Actinophytocola sp.]
MQERRDDGSSPFADELERLLRKRGLSWRRLSDLIGYTPSWLSKIKHGAPPSAELARKCDQVLEAEGQLIALAAASGGPVRLAQLPAAAATFVGRDAELRELSEILVGEGDPGSPQTVAIDGPPGAGKTALALRVAHAVVDQYSDGQLYVDLRGYSRTASRASSRRCLRSSSPRWACRSMSFRPGSRRGPSCTARSSPTAGCWPCSTTPPTPSSCSP